MSPIGPSTRPLRSADLARPTGALGFVCLSAYLTLLLAVLGLLQPAGFVEAMTVFAAGVLAAATVLHVRLVSAGRFVEGAEARRNGLGTASSQVLVACALLGAVALLGGRPADVVPAIAMGVTALTAAGVRIALPR
ncbi:MAG: hypothetical protein ACTHJL_00255 [Amnibacterium sp.]